MWGTKHDVFLSFRGEDTRNGFTSHLYAALCRQRIRTYMHETLVRGGYHVSQSQQEAIIEKSNIYVIIFSENYACSEWCLDELTKILECKERYGRDVIPVFYKVDPSNVRDQTGTYGDAFVKHQHRFRDKAQGWKAALTLAAGLSGWGSKIISPEYLLVEGIVQDIWRKLNLITYSIDHQGLVGMHNHIAKVKSLLHVESAPVRIIGICGIGGIGKTTIASATYHNLASQFSFSSFVVNAQEQIERYGIHHIQSKYLSELLKQKMPVDNLGLRSLKERLKEAKVLLILDNVNNSVHIQDLIGEHGSFGISSRIIVTSRDMQVLENAEVDEIYEVKEMNFQDSLQLFSSNAFKRNYPTENFVSLSEKALIYAKGIPLALKVLGSMLYGRTEEEWKNALQKLEKLADIETSDVLKLIYDGLSDEQKDMFLDIACFYAGHDMNTVKQALNNCGFSATIGMRALIDRGLISVLKGEVVMHDLIQEMGQEIVRQQCLGEPGKRSRLWKHEDIYDVLRENKGTDAVQCVSLDMCQIKQVQLRSETFKMMRSLMLLRFYNSGSTQESKVSIPAFLESLPGNLRFLYWDGFPQRSVPLEFCPENLVELDMRGSHLEQLWERDQHLPNLKRLDLSGSKNLIQLPDLSQSPNIEEIILSQCISLVRVYSSSFLNELNCLWLDGCDGLRSLNLPSNILSKSSGLIVLYDCFNLEFFSVSNVTKEVPLHGHSRSRSIESMFRNCLPGNIIRCQMGTRTARSIFEKFSDTFDPNPMDHVDLGEEPMDNIHLLNLKALREGSPSLFPSLSELCWLDLSYCESLTSLPLDFYKLKYLRRLYLRGCSNLEKLPEIEETIENLMVLILDQTAILELPLSLHHLVGLEELSLCRCRRLKFIPSSIGCLSKLSLLNLTYCESLETLPSSICKLKLTKLDLHGCSILRTFPEILEPAETFAHIRLTKTAVKEIPSSVAYLTGLQTLQLNMSKDLKFLPSSIGNLKLLSKIDFSGCEKLSKLPSDIGQLSSLRELSLHETGILILPESISHLLSLKSLDLSDCKRLECIPGLPPSLEHLFAFDCPSLQRVSSSRVNKLTSDSKEGIFKFHLTNNQELNPSSQSNIAADARLRILHDGYKSVLFCFPGSAVPRWFPYRSKGHSVTLFNKGSINWCNGNRFISFALCVVLGLEGMDDEGCKYSVFSYRFTIECDDGVIQTLASHDQIRYYFHWKGRQRFIVNDHTLIWKYHLDTASMSHVLSRAQNFTFEICEYDVGRFWPNARPKFKVKECGISPLYTNAKDDDNNDGCNC